MQGFDKNKPQFQSDLLSGPVRINFNASATNHLGPSAPNSPDPGWSWVDTSDPNNVKLRIFLNNSWLIVLANITGGPPSQSNLQKFVHPQTTPSTTWTVDHNLNILTVTITVIDATGQIIIPNTIQIQNQNTVTITFLTSETGSAIVVG